MEWYPHFFLVGPVPANAMGGYYDFSAIVSVQSPSTILQVMPVVLNNNGQIELSGQNGMTMTLSIVKIAYLPAL